MTNIKKYLLSILLASKVKYFDRTYDDDSDARQLADFLMKKLELLYPFSEEVLYGAALPGALRQGQGCSACA